MLEFSKKIISSFLLVLILLTFTMVADAVVITSGDTAQAIDANSGAGQVIYTATANDANDISAGVAFSLTADSDQAFVINPVGGEVTLNENPDYDSQSEYNFTVVATDCCR